MKRAGIALVMLIFASMVMIAQPQTGQDKNLTPTATPKPPGYVDMSEKNIFVNAKSKVEINLETPILQILKATTQESDAEFSQLLDSINLLHVQVFEVQEAISRETSDKVSELVKSLKEKEGWSSMVQVNENGKTVNILMKIVDARFRGLSLFVVDNKEAVFINIVGDMDAQKFGRQIGKLTGKFLSGKVDMSKFASLLSGSGNGSEPSLSLTGVVRDAKSEKPIAGAKVSDDKYGPEPYKGAVTDAGGKYSYKTWSEEHGIIAQAPGYKIQKKTLTTDLMHKDKETVLDFALEQD